LSSTTQKWAHSNNRILRHGQSHVFVEYAKIEGVWAMWSLPHDCSSQYRKVEALADATSERIIFVVPDIHLTNIATFV
jgi:hypothetical protein